MQLLFQLLVEQLLLHVDRLCRFLVPAAFFQVQVLPVLQQVLQFLFFGNGLDGVFETVFFANGLATGDFTTGLAADFFATGFGAGFFATGLAADFLAAGFAGAAFFAAGFFVAILF